MSVNFLGVSQDREQAVPVVNRRGPCAPRSDRHRVKRSGARGRYLLTHGGGRDVQRCAHFRAPFADLPFDTIGVAVLGVCFAGRRGLAHRARPFELETIGVVDEAIEDGIGEGWLADEVVPGFDGELTGDQRRGAAMAILDDLHEIASLAGVEAVGTEIVQNEQIDLGQRAEEASEAAIPMRELQLSEEARHARVIGAVSLAAGPLGKGAGEPGFAEATFPANEKITFLGNPTASRELLEERFVELALCAVVDVLDRSLTVAQPRGAQPDLRAFGRAISDLPVEQQCEPFGVGKISGRILLFELDERRRPCRRASAL